MLIVMQIYIFMNEGAQDAFSLLIPVGRFAIVIEVTFSVTTPANIACGTESARTSLKQWLTRVFMMPAFTLFRRVPVIFAGTLSGTAVRKVSFSMDPETNAAESKGNAHPVTTTRPQGSRLQISRAPTQACSAKTEDSGHSFADIRDQLDLTGQEFSISTKPSFR